MKDLLLYIVKNLVTYPDDLKVEEEEQNNNVLLKLYVNKEDMGKVIGKEGKIIKAIRTLLKVRAINEKKRVDLQLVEPPAQVAL
ncbi:KH domain-containing protein [Candidatus Microgenomates bacterium]|nr:KH domain-containing protein [Candidatus Microgenomates bacterium]